jgi:hydroxymethylpyrimidine/phosphomethylpyrimidine kinase
VTERPAVLSIHAFDTAAEDGTGVDAAVGAELGCRTCHVVTAIVSARAAAPEVFTVLTPEIVARQLEAVLAGGRPAAVRLGILADRSQVGRVAEILIRYEVPGIVAAPVARLAGASMLDDAATGAWQRLLFPLARVVVARAAELDAWGLAVPDDVPAARAAALELRSRGARAALVAGVVGHGRVIDLLDDEGRVVVFDAPRAAGPRRPGLGGAHAVALAAHLARGAPLDRAADAAQHYVGARIARGT